MRWGIRFGQSPPNTSRPSPLASLQLDGSQPIFILVVTIRYFDGQSAVAVALPSTAKINRLVDAPNLEVAADTQRDGIVLAVADIRKSDAAQDRSPGPTRLVSLHGPAVVGDGLIHYGVAVEEAHQLVHLGDDARFSEAATR